MVKIEYILKTDSFEYQSVSLGNQQYILIVESSNLSELKEGDKFKIINQEKIDSNIKVNITGIYKYNNIQDLFEIIPYKLTGDFLNKEEAEKYFTNKFSFTKNNEQKILCIRIKNEEKQFKIYDEKLLDLIDIKSVEHNVNGRSASEVIKLKLKTGEDAILKIQWLPSRVTLKDEYERLKWLENMINVPKVIYYNEINNYKYLLMEYKIGKPAYEYSNIGYILGEKLREIHELYYLKKECPFINNSTDKLLEDALKKIDGALAQIQKEYPNETKESIIKFLKENKPKDDVVIHGDYCMPNILINNDDFTFIDVGDLSISNKYFDFFNAIKSFKMNNKENEINEFIKGYGLEVLDETKLKWMKIIDKTMF
jgi:aminoglycoside phosphotransferase